MKWWTNKVNYDSDGKLNVKATEEDGREMQRRLNNKDKNCTKTIEVLIYIYFVGDSDSDNFMVFLCHHDKKSKIL